MKLLTLVIACSALSLSAQPADLVLGDFEQNDYGSWKSSGAAFGSRPVSGTLPDQQPVSGFMGRGYVNSYQGGDKSQGTLLSAPFQVERPVLNFLIGGGFHPGETCLNLVVEGKVVRSATGEDREQLQWKSWEVAQFQGKKAVLEIVDKQSGGWGHVNIDQIEQGTKAKGPVEEQAVILTSPLYGETYRPQFHFTAQKGWLNDPNGLVFYRGEYHLFFQHNPFGNEWGNMTWGHAISTNLIQWQQVSNALEPDALGDMFSGSAVVDRKNTSGFQTGELPPLVLIYTAAGGLSEQSKGKPFTQCLAYSNDRGRTWTKYKGNPVLGNQGKGDRDPKVFWHAPTQRWIMALYVEVQEQGKPIHTVQFFSSPDLKEWQFQSRIAGFYECPDLFELPVENRETRWVLFAADGEYLVGKFNGKEFVPEGGKKKGDWGTHFYAAQTFSDAPTNQRFLVGWMRGGRYPGMPFNQQMSFPCKLTLKKTPDGYRLNKWPVKEIASSYKKRQHWQHLTLPAGETRELDASLFDLELEVQATQPGSRLVLEVGGEKIVLETDGSKLQVQGVTVPLPPQEGRIGLRLLADRTSLELFGNGGLVPISLCYLPRKATQKLRVSAEGGPVNVVNLQLRELKPAWPGGRETGR